LLRRALGPLAALLITVLAACGRGGSGQLTVLGASSLREALGAYVDSFSGADVRASFGGSDDLASEIRQGAPADVFVSADARYPAQLYREGLVERPRPFAGNRLVVAVAAGAGISSLADLARPGVRIVTGDDAVPVGIYTTRLLARLPDAERKAILSNVVARESEVSSVVAKLAEGAADAGFVYATDAIAAKLRAIRLPQRLQPRIVYAAAVVRDSSNQQAARRFLAGLADGAGAVDLRRAGFLPPP
jgi:molybdate transport system substrate-binding protein